MIFLLRRNKKFHARDRQTKTKEMYGIRMLLASACMTIACFPIQCSDRAKTDDETWERQEIHGGGSTLQRPLTDGERPLFDERIRNLTGENSRPESVATRMAAHTNHRFICTATPATPHPETFRTEVTVFNPLPGKRRSRISEIRRLQPFRDANQPELSADIPAARAHDFRLHSSKRKAA